MSTGGHMRWVVLLLLGGAICVARASVLSLLPDRSSPYLTFQLDNDLFFKTDHNYTNGARLTWVSGPKDPGEFNRVQRWLRRLSGDSESFSLFQRLTGFGEPNQLEYKYGFSLTQLMYTPTNLSAPSAPPGQRPYAGWLGLGFSLHIEDRHALNTVEFSLGTIGPHSLAHETQDLIHDWRGYAKFQGWDSQLGNEVTGNLFFTQNRRLRYGTAGDGWSLDGFWEWGFSVGSFRTDALTGGMFRFGWNLPVDFSDPRLSLRSYTHQMAAGPEVRIFQHVSLYGLAGVRGYAVGHDSTLDGSLFHRQQPAVTSEWLVGEAYLGVGLRWHSLEISYSDTYRTREFQQQTSAQKYGSVTLRIRL